MSSPGRRHAEYLAVGKLYRTGQYPCHICHTAPGITVDHVPPLSTATHPTLWQGQLLPACKPCNSRGGADITNRRHNHAWRY